MMCTAHRKGHTPHVAQQPAGCQLRAPHDINTCAQHRAARAATQQGDGGRAARRHARSSASGCSFKCPVFVHQEASASWSG